MSVEPCEGRVDMRPTFGRGMVKNHQDLGVLDDPNNEHAQGLTNIDGVLLWLMLDAYHGLHHGIAGMRSHHGLHPSCKDDQRLQSFCIIERALFSGKSSLESMAHKLLQLRRDAPFRLLF
jgi:hypothetical protein